MTEIRNTCMDTIRYRAGDVAKQIGQFRAGDVLRIPAQAQLAWGRA